MSWMSSAACGLMGVAYAHNPGVRMRCGAWAIPLGGWRVWWAKVFFEEVPADVLPPV